MKKQFSDGANQVSPYKLRMPGGWKVIIDESTSEVYYINMHYHKAYNKLSKVKEFEMDLR